MADVHSNKHALEAVLDDMDRIGVREVLCAGDIVGYGAFPNDCCREVRSRARRTVLGNHDLAALTGDSAGMNPYASAATAWTHGRLTMESKYLLRSLRLSERTTVSGLGIAMFHGSPRSPNDYLYEEQVGEGLLRSVGARLLVLGHTHVPYIVRTEAGVVLNPGSVGQPRDSDPRASYALVDTGSLECRMRRVEYPVEKAAEAITNAGLPKLLADRLHLGR
jgi:putative phosphoesterase